MNPNLVFAWSQSPEIVSHPDIESVRSHGIPTEPRLDRVKISNRIGLASSGPTGQLSNQSPVLPQTHLDLGPLSIDIISHSKA